jgi:hypothetical protein
MVSQYYAQEADMIYMNQIQSWEDCVWSELFLGDHSPFHLQKPRLGFYPFSHAITM